MKLYAGLVEQGVDLQARRACLLHESVTVQSLLYHVKRAEQNEGMCFSGNVSTSIKEAMVIDTCCPITPSLPTETKSLHNTEALSLILIGFYQADKTDINAR
jgi:hypothetical protein